MVWHCVPVVRESPEVEVPGRCQSCGGAVAFGRKGREAPFLLGHPMMCTQSTGAAHTVPLPLPMESGWCCSEC